MDPVTASTTHSHHQPPPFHLRNFPFRFHPILHAPAPHLRLHPRLNLRPKYEPALSTVKQDNNSLQVPSAAEDPELTRRPSGSKNKPKPPSIITPNTANSFQCHVLEISDGRDVANSVAAFAARRQRGLWILSGSGAVADVTIRQPGYTDTVVTLQGRFEILSISGSFLFAQPLPAMAAGVSVYLAGVQGEVMGGSVVGELRASGKVILIAVSFVNAVYERLPLEEEKAVING